MKTLVLGVILLGLISCSKTDCEVEAREATAQYKIAIQYVNSPEAAQKVTNEYNAKINQILAKCN